MVWPLLAMAGMSALQTMQQQKQAGEEAFRTNKELLRVNRANLQRSLIQQSMAAARRSQEIMQNREAQASLEAQRLASGGEQIATAAAAGTVGASVDAVQSDIAMRYSQAKLRIDGENELQELNYNTEMYALLENTRAGQQTMIDVAAARGNKWAPLIAGASTAFGAYASANMNLGLGARTST